MELGYIPSKNKKRRVPAIRGMHLVCVYVCKRETVRLVLQELHQKMKRRQERVKT